VGVNRRDAGGRHPANLQKIGKNTALFFIDNKFLAFIPFGRVLSHPAPVAQFSDQKPWLNFGVQRWLCFFPSRQKSDFWAAADMKPHRSLETISEICDFIDRHRLPLQRLGSLATGPAVLNPAGARLLAGSAAGSNRNAMWLNPAPADCRSAEEVGRFSAGGIGGPRLWQAPEAAHRWQGVPDVGTFSNFRIQPTMDP